MLLEICGSIWKRHLFHRLLLLLLWNVLLVFLEVLLILLVVLSLAMI
jgi:hypothetical protein